VRILEFPQLRLPRLWGPITLCANLRLWWSLKQSCNPCQDLSKGMSHATYRWGNWNDSRLLMVRSQTTNLTLDPSFGHNLCFRCSNGSCKPISDIYVPRYFQWYKEHVNPLSYDPYNCCMKIQESIWDFKSQNESSLGNVKVHSLTLFCTLGSVKCDSWASFLAHTLTSLCLGCKPRARVATLTL
jgi:hypothetical protein